MTEDEGCLGEEKEEYIEKFVAWCRNCYRF